jgi:HEAT repeat protein
LEDIPADRLSPDLQAAADAGDIQYLLEALKDPAFEVRVAAARGLGALGGEKANLVLLSVARDRWGERPEVRMAALRSLGRIHGPERYASILQEFISGDNRKVVAAARRMLQAADPQGFPRRLVDVGALDPGSIRVYGDSREVSALALLRGFLREREEAGEISSSRNWGKVFAAAKALGNIGGREAVEALRELLSCLESFEAEGAGPLARGRVEKIAATTRSSLTRLEKG